MSHPQLMSGGVWPAGISLHTYRHEHGFRLEYSDTGIFDITGSGTEIGWCPRPDTRVDVARHDTLGIVFSMALHAAGVLPLHGSAVAIKGQGVAFLAPSGTGKSTLALALVGAGARLLTDDTLPVDLAAPITVWPGVHSVRLRGDSADRLAGAQDRHEGFDGKFLLPNLPEAALMMERVPLAALYVLHPERPGEGPPARRTPLAGVAAAMGVLGNSRLTHLLGSAESAVRLDRVVSLVGAVPTYRLHVARDLARLDEVVGHVLEWHGAADPVASTAGRPV